MQSATTVYQNFDDPFAPQSLTTSQFDMVPSTIRSMKSSSLDTTDFFNVLHKTTTVAPQGLIMLHAKNSRVARDGVSGVTPFAGVPKTLRALEAIMGRSKTYMSAHGEFRYLQTTYSVNPDGHFSEDDIPIVVACLAIANGFAGVSLNEVASMTGVMSQRISCVHGGAIGVLNHCAFNVEVGDVLHTVPCTPLKGSGGPGASTGVCKYLPVKKAVVSYKMTPSIDEETYSVLVSRKWLDENYKEVISNKLGLETYEAFLARSTIGYAMSASTEGEGVYVDVSKQFSFYST